jgi:hypothetical protein
MTQPQPSNIISLATARQARQAPKPTYADAVAVQQASRQAQGPSPGATAPARKPTPPAPPPLRWHESKAGNPWTTDPRTDMHFVIFETRRGWSDRATPPAGEGFYVDVPSGVSSLVEAQAWAEGWLGMQCIAGAAETRV